MPTLTKKDLYVFLMLFVLSVFFIFWRLGVPSLVNWDEALYAGIAADMAHNGSWTRLELQGTPWFEKEPFAFWPMVTSFKLFGVDNWSARFPAALVGSFVIPLFYLCARRWFSVRAARAVSMVFLISPVFWDAHIARTADFDLIALTLFLAALTAYFYLRHHARYWWVCAVPLALGFLVRGVMGVFPLALIVGFEFARGFFNLPRWSYWRGLFFVVISLAPWLVWHAFAWYRFGMSYVDIYWKEQFFGRITDPLQGHSGPRLYYLLYWQARLKLFFWLMMFGFFALVSRFFTKITYPQAMVVLWGVLFFVPLTLMNTKLHWYGLPLLPVLWIAAVYGVQEIKSDTFLSMPKTPKREYLFRVLVSVLFVALAVQAVIWTSGFITGVVRLKQSPVEMVVAQSSAEVPQGAAVVVYRLGAWNFGRLLPSVYWYTRSMAGWKPLSVDAQNFEHYAARPNEYEWWLTGEDGLEELNARLPKGGFEVVSSMQDVHFVRVKGRP